MSYEFCSILVVDDERPLADEAGALFRQRGWSSEVVYGGRDAIARIRDRNYDVVLLDLRMPEMDGFATLQAILEVRQDACVVFFTAYGDIDASVKALHLGAWSMILKGLRFDAVFEVVNAARIQCQDRKELEKQKMESLLTRSRLEATRCLSEGVTHQVLNRLADAGWGVTNLENAASDAEKRQAISELRESHALIELTIRVLREVWRSDSGQLPVESTDLRSAIEEGYRIARRRMLLVGSSCQLQLTCDESLRVMCQHGMLSQVFENIFHNAMEAIGSRECKLQVETTISAGTVVIRVVDSGPGFSPEMAGKAHHPYETSKGGGKGEGPRSNYGLGLYFVDRVATNSGGLLHYGNNSTGGAFVEVSLPLAVL